MNEQLSKCIRNLTMLRKLDELPEYMQEVDSIQYIKNACLCELAAATHETIDAGREYAVTDIANAIISTVRDNLFTDNDRLLFSYVQSKLVNEGTMPWYCYGTVMLANYRDGYLQKMSELNPSQVYLDIMHPYHGVIRDSQNHVVGLTTY
mgnify:CR=1 FL=1